MSELKWKIRRVNGDVERFMPLLLEADPSRELVERYLAQGELWACEDDSGPAGVALVMPVGGDAVELMNLCTREDLRGQGLGHALVEHIKRHYAGRFSELRVGTADGFDKTQRFYEHCGFSFTHMDRGFFVRNYSEPVYDGDKQCIDMARYALKLSAPVRT